MAVPGQPHPTWLVELRSLVVGSTSKASPCRWPGNKKKQSQATQTKKIEQGHLLEWQTCFFFKCLFSVLFLNCYHVKGDLVWICWVEFLRSFFDFDPRFWASIRFSIACVGSKVTSHRAARNMSFQVQASESHPRDV